MPISVEVVTSNATARPGLGLDQPTVTTRVFQSRGVMHPTLYCRATALCGTCPLRVACLEGAIERREPWGVWGGEIFERGVIIARKRPRGRPRKEEVAA